MKKSIASLFPDDRDIPDVYRIPDEIRQDYYLIDGELRRWHGPLQKIHSPIHVRNRTDGTRNWIGTAPLLDEAAVREALSVAVRAYDNGRGTWPTMPVGERIRCVQRFAAGIRKRKDQVVRLLMWEIGKSVKEATTEFDRSLAYIRDTLIANKELDRLSSRFVIQQGIIGQIRRAPLGVVLCMGPYNFPLYETFTTLIPALVMGNTILLKPPRFGILVFQPLLEAFRDAFPPGVVTTVYGEGEIVIPPLLSSGKVDVLGFGAA